LEKIKELEKILINACDELLSPDGEIFELKINKRAGDFRVFLSLDKISTNFGSFSSAEITKYSKEICRVLEKYNFLSRVSLELSTPGIERPLRNIKEYSRFAGQVVKITYFFKDDTSNGKEVKPKENTGLFEILGIRDKKIQLKKHKKNRSRSVKKAEEVFELEFSQIKKGNLYKEY
jgi:ribosome maturation factor RimP